jgi:hypothetical protein
MNAQNFTQFIGKKISDVKTDIEKLYPLHKIHFVPKDSFVTADYVMQRIRIYYGTDNNVSSITMG